MLKQCASTRRLYTIIERLIIVCEKKYPKELKKACDFKKAFESNKDSNNPFMDLAIAARIYDLTREFSDTDKDFVLCKIEMDSIASERLCQVLKEPKKSNLYANIHKLFDFINNRVSSQTWRKTGIKYFIFVKARAEFNSISSKAGLEEITGYSIDGIRIAHTDQDVQRFIVSSDDNKKEDFANEVKKIVGEVNFNAYSRGLDILFSNNEIRDVYVIYIPRELNV